MNSKNLSINRGASKPIENVTNEKQPNTSGNNSLPLNKLQQQQDRLTSVQKYDYEWLELSRLSEDPFLDQLRQLAVNGALKVSKFRSICWALMLGVLNGRSVSWETQRRCDRGRYAELKKEFKVNPRTAPEDDPLSQEEESVWNKHFCDKELLKIIRQDVVRTFPGVEYFRRPHIQDLMTNILFFYARVNPEMCYRQGMHEILAPILFVMHSDHQALLHIQDISGNDADLSLKEVLDPKFLEEDTYYIFSRIMTDIEPFYRLNDMYPTKSGYFPTVKTSPSSKEFGDRSDLEVVAQLNYIRDTLLAREDPALHAQLVNLDIPLPLFGIRWLRLLFGREYQLMDLLMLWDALFAEGDHLELTHYIVVAMLIAIKEILIHSDYTTSLTYLMKYPTNIDVMVIIRHALHMISPDRYTAPPGVSATSNRPKKLVTRKPFNRQVSHPFKAESSNTIRKNIDLSTQKSASLPRHTHTNGSAANRLDRSPSGSNSMPSGSTSAVRSRTNSSDSLKGISRVNSIQSSTARSSVRIATQQQQPGHEPGIVDGYVENSPEVLKMQLHNAQTIMAIGRLKLMQYLAVLRKYIPGDSIHELHQTMDGIEELCELLKTSHSVPYAVPLPVEPALEANEAAASESASIATEPRPLSPKIMHIPTDTTILQEPSRKSHLTQAEAKREFVRSLQNENKDFEVRVKDEATIINASKIRRHSQPSPTASAAGSSTQSTPTRKPRYEIPDDYITRTAAKILANRKELEMHEFIAAKLQRATNNINIPATERDDISKLPIVDPSGERQSPPNDNY